MSFGGGITGDVSGFVASIFKRGLKFINIPTTLLAQVDSSIGGKTGVNNRYGKNLIGSFLQPDLVMSDINLLSSLPKRELICGYGEILKHSIISDVKNFKYLKKNFSKILKLKTPFIEKAIADSCKIKRKIVQKDEKEKNIRKILNLGHTFAHAYEATLSYSKKLNHGEAVILGIISSAKFSLENNILIKKDYKKIINHISHLEIPLNLNFYFKKKDINSIIKYMLSDKKNNSSKINLILIKKIGKVILNLKFDQSKIKKFLSKELIN
jgi:3-dehydroquinate synthase/shikimate kinase/3-dehydroquinate synthase